MSGIDEHAGGLEHARLSRLQHRSLGLVLVEIRKHPMGPVPKWGLYFYWGRGITRVGFNRPLYPAHVDASDSEFQKLLLVSGLVLSWRAFPQRIIPLSCGCSHNPFFLKEIKAYSSFSHLFSLVPRLFRPNAGTL